MAYKAKAYTLREESTESGIRYFISFKDGQGEHHELEVSEQLFFEFRQMERRNRNLLQWDERHREFSEVWDETLNRRALKLPKSIEEQMIEAERAELLCKAVDRLPEIQRRRFLLYYEYEFNFYQIAAMEHCTATHQCIINICHRYNLCRNWNLFSDQTIRIPFTIITFMMPSADLIRDLDHLLILIMLQLIQHRSINQRMLFHSLKFFFSQLSRQRISSSTYGFSSTSI